MRTFRPWIALAALGVAVVAAPSPALSQPAASKPTVVAAENFWGSIATQLGGDRVSVESIVVDPGSDPHDYEAKPSDARSVAVAQVAIVNGIGYDNWASQLLAASPSGSRVVVNVGDVLGLKTGDNPHQWYSPSSVKKVVAAIVAGYDKVDPAGARYYAGQARLFETKSLARYNALRAGIRKRFAGVAVGASESIFEPLGADLGLRVLTPKGFVDAISEGGELSAKDAQTTERQVRDHQIKVWVFNSQNATPEVQHVTAIARSKHIPVVTVTETLSPVTLNFEQWQVAQLERLLTALHQATAR
jgi:zinc/manganese transport system substrate-binding protein